MIDICVDIAGAKFENPLFAASGVATNCARERKTQHVVTLIRVAWTKPQRKGGYCHEFSQER